jgi:hypothetical protein
MSVKRRSKTPRSFTVKRQELQFDVAKTIRYFEARSFFQLDQILQAFSMIVSVLSFRSGIKPSPRQMGDVPALAVSPRARGPVLVRRALWVIAVLIVAGGVFLAVLGVMADRPHTHLRLQLAWLFPAVAGLAALELAQAELWHRLLRALGGRLDAPHALAIWCVSAVARYVPTSMLMLVVRVRMSQNRGVRGDICLVSVVYEGVLVNCGALCVAAYFVITLPALHGDSWRWGVLVLPLAAICALHPNLFAFLSGRLLRRMGRLPLPAYLSVRQLLSFAAGYIATFVLAGISLVAVVMMLHPLTWQGVPTVIGAMAIGFIASAFAFVLPGGLGVREGALIVALSPILPTVLATATAVAVRLIQLGIEVILALLLPWMAHRRDARRIKRRMNGHRQCRVPV